ncbi:MAG: ribonuclease P protein component [Holosporales bacterium]|jgi:ribonuclease P protein component|nr:ribonuclease P protein component [Holosporales bacterium]
MIKTIKKRPDFLKIYANGVSIKTKSLILIYMRSNGEKVVGYTASKKVGNAILRNRAKRRLRHIVQEFEILLPNDFAFVCIANKNTPIIDFSVFHSDFSYAIKKVKAMTEIEV